LANISIDPDSLNNAAMALDRVNTTISKEFNTLKSKVSSLDDSWRGPSVQAAFALVNKIYQGFPAREAVITNYTKYLREFVAPNYVEVEKTNMTLADQFK
jgi:uncharacterized protein YukE